jgi:hypothetical protein
MLKTILLVTGATLLGGPAFAHTDFNPSASARAARTWEYKADTLAPQASERAALDPTGPTRIASAPVPDTPANRARFGQPLSRAGRMTAPIGD